MSVAMRTGNVVRRLVSGDFTVKLTDAEVAAKQVELVDSSMEAQRLHGIFTAKQEEAKAAKKRVEAQDDKTKGIAQVCHRREERRWVKDAVSEVNVDTWTEVVRLPNDGRILSERVLTESERKEFPQTQLFSGEVEEEDVEAPARRMRLRSPKNKKDAADAAPATVSTGGGDAGDARPPVPAGQGGSGGVLFSADGGDAPEAANDDAEHAD